MFQLDDKFLQDVGLAELPEEQKKAFLEHIYQELELRVGTKLSDGLSEQQLQEFEAFVDRDDAKVREWFAAHLPDYADRADYQQLKAGAPDSVDELTLLAEYGSLKWLELNRPDYKQVVATEMEALKQEISENRDNILSGS